MKKNLKRNGGGTDQSKRAVQAELKEREKLHNKIMSRPQGNLDKHGGDGDSSDDEGADDPAALREQVVGLITEVEGDRNVGEDGRDGAKKKQDGIMGMKFMQRSLQKRREAALDDAKQLLRDIDGGNDETETKTKQDGEDQSLPSTGARGRRKFGGGSNAIEGGAKKRTKNSGKNVDQSEAAQQLRKELRGSQQTASVEMGAGTSTSVSGAISGKVTPAKALSGDGGLFDSSPAVAWDKVATQGSAPEKANAPKDSNTEAQTEEVENPWMSGTHTRRKRSDRTTGSTASGSGDDANKVAEVVTRLAEQQQAREEQERNGNGGPKSKKQKNKRKGQNSNDEAEAGNTSDQDDSGGQAQIVARAFASAGGFKEAFEEEKRRETEESLPQEEKALVGWGSWAGIGVCQRTESVLFTGMSF